MSKAQRRARAREITRLQNERRQAKRDGRSSEEIVVDVEKAVRKGVRVSMARTIRTAPPTETTVAALLELAAGNRARENAASVYVNTTATLPDLTDEAHPDWSDEREKLAGILATPGERSLSPVPRPPSRFARFYTRLCALAIRFVPGRKKGLDTQEMSAAQ